LLQFRTKLFHAPRDDFEVKTATEMCGKRKTTETARRKNNRDALQAAFK